MSQGATRPWGHQGSVDDDGGGGAPPPPSGDFLSTIYAAGLADNPAVHNLMVGTYFSIFVDGSTSGLVITQAPASSGTDFDAHPAIVARRAFDTFPSPGLVASWETSYVDNTPFGDGGQTQQWVNIDRFTNRYTYATENMYGGHSGLFLPGYVPAIVDNLPLTTWVHTLRNLQLGGTSDIYFDSDGAHYRKVLLPSTGGPYAFYATVLNGIGAAGDGGVLGNELVYDSVSVGLGGYDQPGTHEIGHASAVVDALNLGSGQVAGHLEWWVRSVLGGALIHAMSLSDTRLTIPVQIFGTGGGVVQGGLTVDGTFVTTGVGDVDVGGDLNVGSGDAHFGGDVTVPFNLDQLVADGDTLTVNLPGSGPIWKFWAYLKCATGTALYTVEPNSVTTDLTWEGWVGEGTGSVACFKGTGAAVFADGDAGADSFILVRGRVVSFPGLATLIEIDTMHNKNGSGSDPITQNVKVYWDTATAPTSITINGSVANSILATSELRAREEI